MPPEDQKSLHAVLDKLGELFWSFLVHDIHEIWRQHKGSTFPLDAKLALDVAQKVTKINVYACVNLSVVQKMQMNDTKELAVLGDHDIVIVTVTNPKHIGGNAVARATLREIVNGLKVFSL